MDPVTLVGNILNVAKALLGMSEQLRAAEESRREKISHLLARISDCLAGVSGSIRSGEVPHGRCAELIVYAEELPQLIRKDVGNEKAYKLGQTLHSSYDVERMAMSLDQEKDKGPLLTQLEEAAGKFQALSNILRAG